MRFSQNGYYLEEYIKCQNCGVLLYTPGVTDNIAGEEKRFCSQWCIDWYKARTLNGTTALPSSLIRGATHEAKNESAEDERIETRDIVQMSILDSRLVQIAREMGITLMRTSYSTIFSEGIDFTCGLADTEGNLIGTGEFQPSMIGGLPLVISTITKEIPVGSLEDGDIIVHNDPYRGGMHTPEHTFLKPVFVDSQFVGYAVSIGHVAEVGGMVPGAFAGEATEIFHEGLRVPPIKIRKKGKDVEDVWRLMLANYRTPRQNYGDFCALISAAETGAQRYAALVEEYGVVAFRKVIKDLLDYSEARMRKEIQQFPSGVYHFEDFMEDDGIQKKRYRIAVDAYVEDDGIVIDFRRSDPQAVGPINGVLSVARSASYNALLHLTDPTIPTNSGCFRPIRIIAPPGLIVNANYPAPEVGGNTETHIRICYAIIGALSAAVPDRVFATDGGTHSNFLFGAHNARTMEYIVCYDLTCVGWGGRSNGDGNNAVNSITGNSRMNPVEVFETRFPWRVDALQLVPDSGGPGKFRGGLALRKVMTCVAEELTLSSLADRHELNPWGLFGGGSGRKASLLIQRAGSDSWHDFVEDSGKTSPSKFSNAKIFRGDRVMVIAPGGGGYGKPMERNREMIESDLRAGWITEEAARRDYLYQAARK